MVRGKVNWRIAIKSTLATAVIAAGVVVAPSAASAAATCGVLQNYNPGTYRSVSCRPGLFDGDIQYRAVVECYNYVNYRYQYGSYVYWSNPFVSGPSSTATCPTGYHRTYGWTDVLYV